MPPLSCGLQLISMDESKEDESKFADYNIYIDWFLLLTGIFDMIVCPPAIIGSNLLFSVFSDRRLSKAVKTIFKSLPRVFGSTLFFASTSARCLMKANLDEPVLKQCGNPTTPSIMVSIFLAFGWFLGYLVPPLFSGKTMTWADVMAIRMSKVEGTQFMLFGTLATITLILFANTDEGGAEATLFLMYLTMGFIFTIASLLNFVLYESIIKPLLFTSNKTSNSDDNNQELRSSVESFFKDNGALNIGSV